MKKLLWLFLLVPTNLLPADDEATNVPKFSHSYVKYEWVREEVTVEELFERERLKRIEQIKWWSEIQFDEENSWNLNGREGKGVMPWEYYKKRISEFLHDPAYFSKFEELSKQGARIFWYDTPKADWEALGGSCGYIVLNEAKVVLWEETKFN